MKNLIILSCIIILINSNLNAQNGVIRLGGDCMLDNSKILANILFSVDSSFIQEMYEENCKILFIAKIDSNGNLLQINKQRTIVLSSAILSNDFLQEVEDYIIANNILFYVCYSQEPGLKIKNIKEENSYWINIGIPGLFEFQQNLLHYMESLKIIRE